MQEEEGNKMDGKIRCGGGLGGAAITGSYTRFAQQTACTRSGAMRRGRDARQKSKTNPRGDDDRGRARIDAPEQLIEYGKK